MWRLSEVPFSWEGDFNSIWSCFEAIDRTNIELQGDKNHVWLAASLLMYTAWFVRNSNRAGSKNSSPEGFLAICRKLKVKWSYKDDYKTVADRVLDCNEGDNKSCITDSNKLISRCSMFGRSSDSGQWLIEKPPPGWFLILTDADYNKLDQSAAFGAVIIDRHGHIVGNKSSVYSSKITFGAEEAELLAIEHRIGWVLSLKLPNLAVFSDALNIVNCHQKNQILRWQLLPIQEKLFFFLQECYLLVFLYF